MGPESLTDAILAAERRVLLAWKPGATGYPDPVALTAAQDVAVAEARAAHS